MIICDLITWGIAVISRRTAIRLYPALSCGGGEGLFSSEVCDTRDEKRDEKRVILDS